MDRFKNVAKGGWHPSGDRQIRRDTWKSDLKGMATGKKNDPYADAREHQSAPLSSLKDPDSFGPPPKHTGAFGSSSEVGTATSSTGGGLGAPVPQAARANTPQRVQEEQEQAPAAPPVPYRTNTTGLRTDNLPKPPVRRGDAVQNSGSQSPAPSPMLPPRQPPRQTPQQTAPPPSLPPRQTEYPDEYTPAPPPTYTEATRTNAPNPAAINQGAASRLGQAGVSVPGFDIGSASSSATSQSPVRGPQLGELQARFARMNAGGQSQTANVPAVGTAPSQKKAPPPPPPKKSNLSGPVGGQQPGYPPPADTSADAAPPPVPFGSKPR